MKIHNEYNLVKLFNKISLQNCSVYTESPHSGFGFLEVNKYLNMDAAVYQRFTRYDIPDESYIRVKANNAWGAWKKHPTRAEVDELSREGNYFVTTQNNYTAITEGQDLNDIYNAGLYYIGSAAIARTVVNCPSTLGGRLEVYPKLSFSNSSALGGRRIKQRYIVSVIPEQTYERGWNGSTWSSWELLPTRAEMDAVSTVETITAEVDTEEVASGNFIIKKVGNVVCINGYVILANPTKTNAAITLATLPQNVRPSVAIRTTAAVAAHAYEQPEGMCYASVGTNGVLSVRLQTDNLAKNNTVYMSISYII